MDRRIRWMNKGIEGKMTKEEGLVPIRDAQALDYSPESFETRYVFLLPTPFIGLR